MISGSPISCRPRCECQVTPDEEGDGSCKGCRAGGTGLGEHHSNEEGLSSGQEKASTGDGTAFTTNSRREPSVRLQKKNLCHMWPTYAP